MTYLYIVGPTQGVHFFNIFVLDQKFDRETISLFLEKQANINAINASGETPLVRYIKREARKLYNLKLLRRQIRNTGKNDLVDNIKYLLKYGADPNAYGDGVDSPLMTATIHDMHGIISQMIDAKAKVNYKRKDGKTALHLYMEKGTIINENVVICIRSYELLENIPNTIFVIYFEARVE